MLNEAETLLGPSPVLDVERRRHGSPTATRAGLAPGEGTAWEHYALGRVQLRAGDLEAAAAHFDRALALQPQALWPHWYVGLGIKNPLPAGQLRE